MTILRLKKLANYLAAYKVDLIIVTLSLFCVSAALLILGQTFRRLIDNGLNTHHALIVNNEILIICSLIVIFGIGSFFRSYNINNITEKVINQIRLDAFTNLINQKIIYFENRNISHIVSKLTLDLELVAKLITNFLSFFIRNFIMLFGSIIMMFLQSYKLSIIVIVSVPLVLLPLLKLGKYIRYLSKQTLELQSNIISVLTESLTYVRVIHSFNQQNNRILVFKSIITEYLHKTSNRLKIRSIFFAVTISIILLSITFVIWIGSNDILSGNMSPGKMLSFIYYALLAGLSAGGIAEVFSEIQSPLIALERVLSLVDAKETSYLRVPAEDSNLLHRSSSQINPRRAYSNSKNMLDSNFTIKSIEFKDVSFSYPSRPDLVSSKNISFSIYFDSFVGVIGPSGAGKSTIAQLMLKFYDPSSGSILINDINISQINTKHLRSIIAYVPQESNIFSGTIKSNIALSRPEASDEEIDLVAHITGIASFANGFEHKLDTDIGQIGVRLSGGQKQRIAIARALLYKPYILILDEATSSIDNKGEQSLLSQIKVLMKNKIIISIAHRISSLDYADQILVIEKGVITSHGTQAHLANTSSFYYNLLSNQNSD
ncbi:MAG: ABC transporter ATP-binding protein [Janthinobacterium lividum]